MERSVQMIRMHTTQYHNEDRSILVERTASFERTSRLKIVNTTLVGLTFNTTVIPIIGYFMATIGNLFRKKNTIVYVKLRFSNVK